jgi:hypothetical protein
MSMIDRAEPSPGPGPEGFRMRAGPETGRRCTAIRADGRRCRGKAMNDLAAPLCSFHAPDQGCVTRGVLKHGFYAQQNLAHLEYLRRIRPESYVEGGGLALGEGRPVGIRQRRADLHPPQPEPATTGAAIAALLHKMEILDALIFRAEEHGLEVTKLLALYLQAISRLAGLVRDRDEMAGQEDGDLLCLLERANALLERKEQADAEMQSPTSPRPTLPQPDGAMPGRGA